MEIIDATTMTAAIAVIYEIDVDEDFIMVILLPLATA